MARSADSVKVRQWERRMARFGRSRRPVAAFCQDEGVSVAAFYHWRKKLRHLPGPTGDAEQPAATFTPVRLMASSSMAVRLPGGTQLDVPTADPQLLKLALQTLAEVDARRVTGASPC